MNEFNKKCSKKCTFREARINLLPSESPIDFISENKEKNVWFKRNQNPKNACQRSSSDERFTFHAWKLYTVLIQFMHELLYELHKKGDKN